jgi:hypothetical protein
MEKMEIAKGFGKKVENEKNVEKIIEPALRMSSMNKAVLYGICNVFLRWIEDHFPERKGKLEESFLQENDVKQALKLGGKYEWVIGEKFKLVICRGGIVKMDSVKEQEILVVFEAIPAFKKDSKYYKAYKSYVENMKNKPSEEAAVFLARLEEGKSFLKNLREYLSDPKRKLEISDAKTSYGWRAID